MACKSVTEALEFLLGEATSVKPVVHGGGRCVSFFSDDGESYVTVWSSGDRAEKLARLLQHERHRAAHPSTAGDRPVPEPK